MCIDLISPDLAELTYYFYAGCLFINWAKVLSMRTRKSGTGLGLPQGSSCPTLLSTDAEYQASCLRPFQTHFQCHLLRLPQPCVDHWAHAAAAAKSLHACPTLRDPIDGSPPGSPVPGILQARTLEWIAISFSNA